VNPIRNPDGTMIRRMFDDLAPRYDLFNRLTSMGMDAGWRRDVLKPVKPGMRVLDLGCGTGDLALMAAERMQGSGEVVGLDFSGKMLEIAEVRRQKTPDNAARLVRWEQGRAEDLPFEQKSYDLAVSGFVLRNLYENIDAILVGVYTSLALGGRISFLDITEPRNKTLKKLWTLYMTTVVAIYGKLLFGKAYPMFYLTDSARRFLKSDEFAGKLKATGFENVRARHYLFGIITLYSATKPGAARV
jgi:demethylmenaquinone methyltransferase/2-methoxy-6-polyprenyl-1,4-benzoquinol methylase